MLPPEPLEAWPAPGREADRWSSASDIEALFALAAGRAGLCSRTTSARAGQREMARAVAQHARARRAPRRRGRARARASRSPTCCRRCCTRCATTSASSSRPTRINLQEQLAGHDMPVGGARWSRRTRARGRASVRATVLKGRANYLCLERWAAACATIARPRTQTEARLHAPHAAWLPDTETGDLAELYMPSQDEREAWSALSAAEERLPVAALRVRARRLVLPAARARSGPRPRTWWSSTTRCCSRTRPPRGRCCRRSSTSSIDEAHRLEEVATQQYGALALASASCAGCSTTWRSLRARAARLQQAAASRSCAAVACGRR